MPDLQNNIKSSQVCGPQACELYFLSEYYSWLPSGSKDIVRLCKDTQKNSTRIPFLKINDDLFCNMLK